MGCSSSASRAREPRLLSPGQARHGVWGTTFRDIELRDDTGRYMGVWGNLFDLKWQSATHLKGRFRNAEMNDKTGVFEWFFEDASCRAFTGRWRWDSDTSWQGQAWTGTKKPSSVASTASQTCKDALGAAIARGAPLWNRGDYKGCGQVYKAVAEKYAHEDDRLFDALRRGRHAPLDGSRKSLGWILRDTFDAILEPWDGARVAAAGGSTAREASDSCKDALRAAINRGTRLWNAGDYFGCSELYRTVAAKHLKEDERLAEALLRSRHAPADSSAPDSMGWILRRAFDAILEGAPTPRVAKAPPREAPVAPVAESGRDEQELEQASPAELVAIQELFDRTFKNKRTSDRGDGEMPARLVVVQAQRNMNSRQLSKYEDTQSGIQAGRTSDELAAFNPASFVEGNLLSERLEWGEAYLFHGTSPEATVSIAKHDFRLDAAGRNRGTMFGPGIYLAENSSKADEYAKDGTGALYKGIFAMLLCRVTLGKVCSVEKAGNYKSKVTSGEYDAVIGDREKAVGTYREVVLFKSEQVFPEYAVLYRRDMTDPPPHEDER